MLIANSIAHIWDVNPNLTNFRDPGSVHIQVYASLNGSGDAVGISIPGQTKAAETKSYLEMISPDWHFFVAGMDLRLKNIRMIHSV